MAKAFEGKERKFIYVNVATKNFDYHPKPAGRQEIAQQFFAASGYMIPALPMLIVTK